MRQPAVRAMGYFPVPEGMTEAVASMFVPNPRARVGDFTAGEGEALLAFTEATGSIGFANEIEPIKFDLVQSRFRYATKGDFFKLEASKHLLSAAWLNPPYAQENGEECQDTRHLRMVRRNL